MIAVVVEETFLGNGNRDKWNSYCKNMKKCNDDMWNREFFVEDIIKKVHVIIISDYMQFVIHKNLNLNFHYSIR